MGNTTDKKIQIQQYYRFPYQKFYKIQDYLWRNSQNMEDKVKQVKITLNSQEQINKFYKQFLLRKSSDSLVHIKYLNLLQSKQICSSTSQVTIFIESDELRLPQISNIPYPDYLHLYYNCLRGSYQIYNQVGAFSLDEEHICLNSQAKIKIWMHNQLYQSQPQHPMCYSAEKQMLRQILFILKRKLYDQSHFRRQNFFKTLQNQKTIKGALQTLNKWAKKHGATIPQSLSFLKNGIIQKPLTNLIKSQFQLLKSSPPPTYKNQNNYKFQHPQNFNSYKINYQNKHNISQIKNIKNMNINSSFFVHNETPMPNKRNSRSHLYRLTKNIQNNYQKKNVNIVQKPITSTFYISHFKKLSNNIYSNTFDYKALTPQKVIKQIIKQNPKMQLIKNSYKQNNNFLNQKQSVLTNINTHLKCKQVNSQLLIMPQSRKTLISREQFTNRFISDLRQNPINNSTYLDFKSSISIDEKSNIIGNKNNYEVKLNQKSINQNLNPLYQSKLQSILVDKKKMHLYYQRKPIMSLNSGVRKVESMEYTNSIHSNLNNQNGGTRQLSNVSFVEVKSKILSQQKFLLDNLFIKKR